MSKWQNKKTLVAKFADVEGDNGWTLSKSDVTKRYNLKQDGKLVLSDVALAGCVHCAGEHDVSWVTKPEIEWVFE